MRLLVQTLVCWTALLLARWMVCLDSDNWYSQTAQLSSDKEQHAGCMWRRRALNGNAEIRLRSESGIAEVAEIFPLPCDEAYRAKSKTLRATWLRYSVNGRLYILAGWNCLEGIVRCLMKLWDEVLHARQPAYTPIMPKIERPYEVTVGAIIINVIMSRRYHAMSSSHLPISRNKAPGIYTC